MNSAGERELANLRALLDYPESPVAPDPEAIMVRARRLRDRRRAIGTGAVAIVAVVAVAAGILIGGARDASVPRLVLPNVALPDGVLVANRTVLAAAPRG